MRRLFCDLTFPLFLYWCSSQHAPEPIQGIKNGRQNLHAHARRDGKDFGFHDLPSRGED